MKACTEKKDVMHRKVWFRGNTFKNIYELQKAYGFDIRNIERKLKNGAVKKRDIEHALECQVTDNNGNVYRSFAHMLDAYEVDYSMYDKSIRLGMSMQDALRQKSISAGKKATDFNGDVYKNVFDMCKSYYTTTKQYLRLTSEGKTQKEALSTGGYIGQIEKLVDDKPTFSSLCIASGVKTFSALKALLSRMSEESLAFELIMGYGKTDGKGRLGSKYDNERIEEPCVTTYSIHNCTGRNLRSNYIDMSITHILRGISERLESSTKAASMEISVDAENNNKVSIDSVKYHGNIFRSIDALCAVYGVDSCEYKKLVSDGLGIEEALDKSISGIVSDGRGRMYGSLDYMCDVYEVDRSKVDEYAKDAANVRKLLENKSDKSNVEVTDHEGRKYRNVFIMCREYLMTTSKYYERLEKGMTQREALLLDEAEDLTRILIDNPTFGEMCTAAGLDTTKKLYAELSRSSERDIASRMLTCWEKCTERKNRLQCLSANEHIFEADEALGEKYIKYMLMENPGSYRIIIRKLEYILQTVKASYGYSEYLSELGSRIPADKAVHVVDVWEDAATENKVCKENINTDKCVMAPNGKSYRTAKEMCADYGATYLNYLYRINHGYTLEEALNTGKYSTRHKKGSKKERTCTEAGAVSKEQDILIQCRTGHNGIVYGSVDEMLKAYGISRQEYKKLLAEKGSKDEVLRSCRRKRKVTDHLGNSYENTADMCKAYNIKRSTYFSRLDSGWSLKDALEKPVDYRFSVGKSVIYDHLGNTYKSISEMCRAYGVKRSTFDERMSGGWSLKDALEKRV